MYCKECGKEIADDSIFCSFCGTKLKDVIKQTEKNNADTDENSAIAELFYNKKLSAPTNLTVRNLFDSKEWWNGELYIGSNAIFLCNSETFDAQSICSFFLTCFDNFWYEVSEDNIPHCFKSAIKSALSDYKQKKSGDLYMVSVTEMKKYARELGCIVQITGRSYKYIVGVIRYLNNG